MKMLNQISPIKAARVVMLGLLLGLMVLTQACNDAVSALEENAPSQRLEHGGDTLAPLDDPVNEERGGTDPCEAFSCRDDGDGDDPGDPFVGRAKGEIRFSVPPSAGFSEGSVSFSVRTASGSARRTARGSLFFENSVGVHFRAKIKQAEFSARGEATFSGPIVGGNLNTLVPVSIFVRVLDGGVPGPGNDQFVFLIANPDEVPDGILPEGEGTAVTILAGDIRVEIEQALAPPR